MPKLSQRGIDMPSSPIRKLVPYADRAGLDGKHVIHLNIGQPDIKTPQLMLDAIHHYNHDIIEYTQSGGIPAYRKKLLNYYRRLGITLNIDNVMITTGGSEALVFAFFSTMDDGDEVIVPEPFYANYNGFSQAGNIVIKPITASIENGFALPPIDAFEDIITEKTKSILICNPNNPTGYFYSREELEKLRDLVLKHDIFLFVDEVYREFVYDGRKHVSILEIDGLENHCAVIDSVSKRYSACGARIGALISRNEMLMSTALKFAQARLSPPNVEQYAAMAAVDVPASYFDDVREEYVQRRNYIVGALNDIEGITCPNPGGAFYCIAELPVDDAEDFCKWLLTDFEHEGNTIMLAPGEGFYSTKGLGKKQVRIAYVLNIDELKKAIECLKLAIPQYQKSVQYAEQL